MTLPYALARLVGWPGIILAHIVIGMSVLYWDIRWVQEEMGKPGWEKTGKPDLDMIFMFGALFRIVVINVLVTPGGILGAVQRHVKRTRTVVLASKNATIT